MTSPRDILDERLARGEITPEEHAKLAGHLGPEKKPAQADRVTPSAQPGGSWLWAVVGLISGFGLYRASSGVFENIIAECMKQGSSHAFCEANAVNWPVVYGVNGLAILLVGTGLLNLFRILKPTS